MLHKTILLLVVGAILLHLSGDESEAAIYKWKDESGKTYFTDDPNRLPKVFRKEHFKRKLPPAIQKSNSPIKPEEKSALEKDGVAPEDEEDTEKEKSKKDEGLTAAEKSAAEAVIAFFKEVTQVARATGSCSDTGCVLGGVAPEDIPIVEPSDYISYADYILKSDGFIQEVSSGDIYTVTNPRGGN